MFGRLLGLASPVVFLIPAIWLAGCSAATPPPAPAVPATPAQAVVAPAPTQRPPNTTAPAAPPTAAPTSAPTAAPAGSVSLRWFGQATFLLTTSRGTTLLIDPTAPSSGYTIAPMSADVVTVSHEHADHNDVSRATGSPVVVRGLKDGDWVQIDQTVKDVRIRSFPTYHDDQKGASRGKNSLFLFEVDGLRIAHLGDLGHQLSQEQAAALGKLDVVMIPVGGGYTLDAAGATKVVEQLSPRAVLPMHYRTPKVSAQSPLVAVDPFLEGKKVERPGTSQVEFSRDKLPTGTTVYLPGYE